MVNPKETEILEYVKNHILEKGFAPSIREICKKFGFSSPRSGQKYLESLEEQGLIKRVGVSRGIKVLSYSERSLQTP